VDLSSLAGQTVTLALEADADRVGTVALWAAPTLTGAGDAERPNVIFYVIDAGGADYMSVYGYNRRTTPNLERLAAGGAVFEHAYSNATWTKPSTASFMTSLQSSVLGGLTGFDPVPEQAVTMAQHLHRAGYQTAVFTSNPSAGTASNLERGVDAFRDAGVFEHSSASSTELHEDYWRWREAYPAEPYWVHFQTTDVATHSQSQPVAPFAGLFTSPELRESYYEWDRQMAPTGGRSAWSAAYAPFADSGISRLAFFGARRGLYDENIAHNDYQIGRLVERLKARGEWENTLLIVAADHGSHSQQGLGVLDSLPPRWGPRWGPMFRSSVTRVPLIFVWPGRIPGGQRLSQPVSMIDVLPTILELTGLPRPEVMQGQSLAPLLLGEEGWETRPVILDEFYVDQETGDFRGRIEVIDGRWGASLEINPEPPEEDEDEEAAEERRPVSLLLYDLWNDPMALWSVHEERPHLVEKYTAFLEAQFEAHQALAQQFTPGEGSPLTQEQLETLRALGYIQ
jgi:arylsulfatase A-like enzyme